MSFALVERELVAAQVAIEEEPWYPSLLSRHRVGVRGAGRKAHAWCILGPLAIAA
jgi:hypothetical protein